MIAKRPLLSARCSRQFQYVRNCGVNIAKRGCDRMSVWSTYEARLGASNNSVGDPKRNSALDHAQGRISRKITASLSYNTVKVNGVDKQVSIKDVTGDYT